MEVHEYPKEWVTSTSYLRPGTWRTDEHEGVCTFHGYAASSTPARDTASIGAAFDDLVAQIDQFQPQTIDKEDLLLRARNLADLAKKLVASAPRNPRGAFDGMILDDGALDFEWIEGDARILLHTSAEGRTVLSALAIRPRDARRRQLAIPIDLDDDLSFVWAWMASVHTVASHGLP